ncbi:hypothetical protein [Nocardia concava]|uniref:hypothetical protein n=1 Tax=Nocardia concava TaxID=257281 RepID=UPI000593BD69|nr:hypothetical protein [Nocardia concava]
MPESATRPRALTIGLHPRAMDYSRSPDLDEVRLTARVDAANDALRNSEFDVTPLLVGTSPDDAESELRTLFAHQRFDVVMIGGAIRAFPDQTLLFERIINVLTEIAPGIRFCFNTSPETTLDALRRVSAPI